MTSQTFGSLNENSPVNFGADPVSSDNFAAAADPGIEPLTPFAAFLERARGKTATNVDLAALVWLVMIVGVSAGLFLPH